MKGLLLRVICLFVLARAAWAFEPFTVRDIRVEGIQRIEAGTVFSYLPVKVGETMTDEKASQAIRALFGTGFFRDVRLEVDRNVLVVVVEERPAIASIDFVGMKEFDKEQVKKGLRDVGFQEGRTFDRAQLERAEQEIKRQYLTRGKYGVVVTTTVTPLERNRVGINFGIDEGEVARIRSINIVGNQVYAEKDLVALFVLRTPGWFTWYTKNDQYSRQKLQGDLENLRSYYMNRGFLDFNIDSTQVSITPDKRDIYITVNISEGEKYTVSDVKIGGDPIVAEEELRKLITLKPGDAFILDADCELGDERPIRHVRHSTDPEQRVPTPGQSPDGWPDSIGPKETKTKSNGHVGRAAAGKASDRQHEDRRVSLPDGLARGKSEASLSSHLAL